MLMLPRGQRYSHDADFVMFTLLIIFYAAFRLLSRFSSLRAAFFSPLFCH